jgi:hypothetical protein
MHRQLGFKIDPYLYVLMICSLILLISCQDHKTNLAIQKIQTNIYAFETLPEDLQTNKEVVLALLQMDGTKLEWIDSDLKTDRDVIATAIHQTASAFDDLPSHIKADKDVVLLAVEKNGLFLKDLPIDFKEDGDVVLAAIKQNIDAFQYISDRLKSDDLLIEDALNIAPKIIKFLTEDQIKQYPEAIDEVLMDDGRFLKYMPIEIKTDEKRIAIAIMSNTKAVFEIDHTFFKKHIDRYADMAVKAIIDHMNTFSEDELLEILEKYEDEPQLLKRMLKAIFARNGEFYIKVLQKNDHLIKGEPTYLLIATCVSNFSAPSNVQTELDEICQKMKGKEKELLKYE